MAKKRAPWPLLVILLGSLLAAGGLMMAPQQNERRAMEQRELYERAQTLYMAGDHVAGIDVLRRAVAKGAVNANIVRTLLSYYSVAHRASEHFALLQSEAADLLDARDLRSAISLYETSNMGDAANSVRRMLAKRGQANPGEQAALAQQELGAGHASEAIGLAERAGRAMSDGATPAIGASVVRTLTSAKRPDLARAFLSRWLTADAPVHNIVAITPALIETGYPEYAVAALRAQQRRLPEAHDLYLQALRGASAQSQQLRSEFTNALLTDIPQLSKGERLDVALHDLFAYGDLDQAIAGLSANGTWRGEAIRPAFVYGLREHGRTAALASLLYAEAVSPATSAEAARGAARELAEMGAVPQAANALMTIASREGPAAPAVGDLFYVWASHHLTPDTAWFANRVRMSDAAGAEAWVAVVGRNVSGAAAAAVVDASGVHDDARARSRLAVLKARYLGWNGDTPALRQAIAFSKDQPLSVDEAGEMARLSCLIGDADDATALMPRAAGSSYTAELDACTDRFALLAARRAVTEGRLSDALARYEAVAAAGDVMGAQDYFDYAEAANEGGTGAAELYETALARLPGQDRETLDDGLLRAVILTRLQRWQDARSAYEAVYAQHPRNKRARVALVEFLLDRGDFRAALPLTAASSETDAGLS
jgi:hypothetical protein